MAILACAPVGAFVGVTVVGAVVGAVVGETARAGTTTMIVNKM